MGENRIRWSKPCTKMHGRGPVPFTHLTVEVSVFIYLFKPQKHNLNPRGTNNQRISAVTRPPRAGAGERDYGGKREEGSGLESSLSY